MTTKLEIKQKIGKILERMHDTRDDKKYTALMRLCMSSNAQSLKTIKEYLRTYDVDLNETSPDGTVIDILVKFNPFDAVKKLKFILKSPDVKITNDIIFVMILKEHKESLIMFDMILDRIGVNPVDEEGRSLLNDLAYDDREISTTYMKILLSKPFVDVNRSEETALYMVCSSTNDTAPEKLKLLLERSDLKIEIYDGILAVCDNTSKQAPKLLELLLADGRVDINEDNGDDSPVDYLCYNDSEYSLEMLKRILQIDNINLSRLSASDLMRASDEKIDLLLDRPGIDINARDDEGMTLLMYAARKRNSTTLDKILAYPGIDVSIKDGNLRTFLHCLCSSGRYYNISSIPGLDINAQDSSYGMTALMLVCAVESEYIFDMVYFITNYPGVDVNKSDINGKTALHAICMSNSEHLTDKTSLRDTLKYLLMYTNVNPKTADNSLEAPIHSVVFNEHRDSLEFLDILLSYGKIDVNVKDLNSRSPLSITCYICANGETEEIKEIAFDKIKMLIQAGADIYSQTLNGLTPLMFLCRCDSLTSYEAFKYIISYYDDVNQVDVFGNTALSHVCMRDNDFTYDLINILLDAGANPNILNNEGETANSILESNDRSFNRLTQFYQ